MADPTRLAFLRSALQRAETHLKLAVARQRWREAIEHATEAAAMDDALRALPAEDQGPRNVVGRVRAQG